jgi:hypothetical protein
VREIVEIRKAINDGLLCFVGLNTVLSNDKALSQKPRWGRDGAFILHAQEQGADSHLAAYRAVIDELTEMPSGVSTEEIVPIGERLWKYGHPFAYTGGR